LHDAVEADGRNVDVRFGSEAEVAMPQRDVRFAPIASFRVANFIEKASRLYEQKRSAVIAVTALEMYVRAPVGHERPVEFGTILIATLMVAVFIFVPSAAATV
jgi:hypothetical protein